MVQRSRLSSDWLLLAGFCGFLFFFGLAAFGFIGADEPRYAQVAREMLARRDWITPTLGGKPWLEKPALFYWQAMLAYSILGVKDWVARLPSALDATLMVIGVYWFLRRFRPGFELDGALMTAAAAGVIGFGRAASTDMPLAATFTLALLAWYAWHESGRRAYLAACYVMLALAALAKGPVAPCLAAVIVALFAWAKRDWAVIQRTLWLPGILAFCAVALPWYVAVQVKNSDFFRVFILEHNLARFGTNLYHHPQPFWFYLPVTLLGLLPWTVFAAAAMVECFRQWWARGREMLLSQDGFDVFLAIWLLAPVIFFSLSRSKLPGYILPALPAGTLLLGEFVRRRVASDKLPNLALIVLHAVTAAAPIIPALMIQYIVLQHRLPWGHAAAVSTGFAALLAAGIAVTLRSHSGLRTLRFVTLVPVVLTVAAALRIGGPALNDTLSARPLAAEIAKMENGALPAAVFQASRETEYGLQFYRDQPIERYERGEIPAGEHVLVAPQGTETQVKSLLEGRRVSYLGTFEAQRLDYYWVAGAAK